jgi:hypothetical protein
VRPFEPSCGWSTINNPEIAVYTRMEDLQADLPKLLDQVEKYHHQSQTEINP